MAFLVRLVQTYSVFKQIAKSICNEYSICFSSQNLPYSGASDFVKVRYAHHYNIVKSPKWKNPPWAFWYAGQDSREMQLLRNSPPDCFSQICCSPPRSPNLEPPDAGSSL